MFFEVGHINSISTFSEIKLPTNVKFILNKFCSVIYLSHGNQTISSKLSNLGNFTVK